MDYWPALEDVVVFKRPGNSPGLCERAAAIVKDYMKDGTVRVAFVEEKDQLRFHDRSKPYRTLYVGCLLTSRW